MMRMRTALEELHHVLAQDESGYYTDGEKIALGLAAVAEALEKIAWALTNRNMLETGKKE